MLSYLDYLVFLHAVFCTEQLYAFRRIIFSMFFKKKKVKNNLLTLHGLQTYQNGGSSKCSYMSTLWCFCTRFFAQNNSMHSVESFSACFCEKKKLKITCSFCMGYRLTKMEDLQNPLTSRLFGVFARGIFHRTTLCIPQNHFQDVFAKKKVQKKPAHFAWGIDLPKWRIFKMLSYPDYLVFLHAVFCTEQLYAFRRIIFGMFAKKKVENNLLILHGLQTYQNGGSLKCSNISTIWCFCTRFFAQNNSMHSAESFSACFCEKKS